MKTLRLEIFYTYFATTHFCNTIYFQTDKVGHTNLTVNHFFEFKILDYVYEN